VAGLVNELTDDKSLKFIATQRGRTCDQKAIPAQRQTAVCAALSWRAFNTEPRVSPGPGAEIRKRKDATPVKSAACKWPFWNNEMYTALYDALLY
jgi:hypothetical protein